MGIDFDLLNAESYVGEKKPKVYCVTGVHPESDSFWIEAVFFLKSDAKKVALLLSHNKPIDNGIGFYEVIESRIGKLKE